MVFPGEVFDPQATLASLQEERCTALFAVPTMYVAMLEHENLSRTDITSMRTGIMAGAPPEALIRRAIRDLNMPGITVTGGRTEMSPVTTQSASDDPVERRVTTIGRVDPHVELKIVDERGRTVGIGERGEICAWGYGVMKGYWSDQPRTREVIDADGFLHAGDRGEMDTEGYIRIVGRLKDRLIRGGEHILRRELEDAHHRHPNIRDAHVFGVPDPYYGEEVCAWVLLKTGTTVTADVVREHCRAPFAHEGSAVREVRR